MEAPESLAAVKPKPVRTIVLPQLPDPSEPVARTAPEPAAPSAKETIPEAIPQALTILLPEPDETPLRVEPSTIPKRYEAPSVRPELSSGGMQVPAASDFAVAMLDPLPVEDARAAAFARSVPELHAATAVTELYDPSVPDSESAAALARLAPAYTETGDEYILMDPSLPGSGRADAIARLTPRKAPAGMIPELVWPELEADEIPEVLLASLAAPAPVIPATSLAEGEIILPARAGPSAIALETPAYGAAETMVALDDAEAEAVETPTAESLAGLAPASVAGTYDLALAEARDAEKPHADGVAATAPADSAAGVDLAEAAEQKPETSPLLDGPAGEPAPVVALDQPKEYIIAMEPTGPKPPVVPATPGAPVIKIAPPAVTVAPPVSVAPAVSIATVSEALEKGRFYIQVGAYGSETQAKESAGKLKTGYAILIQKLSAKGKDTWRVYVGPLSRDESGVALVRVRAMGYKDAFVKSGS
jgi:cell division protein FtsN